mmetsp:Transcript_47383/g.98300  ORF Transcript_47383/g.98300 Transcript_47383/m.98300 type:complete len:204 (+) Transcript_47383:558-1169(+)
MRISGSCLISVSGSMAGHCWRRRCTCVGDGDLAPTPWTPSSKSPALLARQPKVGPATALAAVAPTAQTLSFTGPVLRTLRCSGRADGVDALLRLASVTTATHGAPEPTAGLRACDIGTSHSCWGCRSSSSSSSSSFSSSSFSSSSHLTRSSWRRRRQLSRLATEAAQRECQEQPLSISEGGGRSAPLPPRPIRVARSATASRH